MRVVKAWRERSVRDVGPGIGIAAEDDDGADYLEVGGNLQKMYKFAAFTGTCVNRPASNRSGISR